MDPEVENYVAGIAPELRPLFDRIHQLILDTCPSVRVVLAYKMPTYQLGDRRMHVGVWAHGVSIYGWKRSGDGGFTARHPELQSSTGTIRLRLKDAASVADDEFRELVRAALAPS